MIRVGIWGLAMVFAVGCSGNASEPVTTAVDADADAERIDAVIAQTRSLISRNEAKCWLDKIVASGVSRSELTDSAGDVRFRNMMYACLDPSEVVPETAISDEARASFAQQLGESVGFDEAQASCLIDHLAEAGFGSRALLLASRPGVELPEPFAEAIAVAATTCQ